MKDWLSNLMYKLNDYMRGRYGYDELSKFLLIAGLILMIFSFIPQLKFLYIIGFVLIVWSWLRVMSTNIYGRQMELNKYMEIKNKFEDRFHLPKRIRLYKSMWRDRKTHKYYKCPHCKTYVRIKRPEKGKKIAINCPKCGNRFEKRT